MQPKKIAINRGDTYVLDLIIPDRSTGEKYYLQDDDVVYFGVMDPRQMFEDALIRKRYTKEDMSTSGIIRIIINPEDTIDLIPGTYYYAIKLHKFSDTEEVFIDEVETVINKTKFIICD